MSRSILLAHVSERPWISLRSGVEVTRTSSQGSDRAAVTLLFPEAARSSTSGATTRLSTQLLEQSVKRLRILALLYAFTFFMAAFVPNLVIDEFRARFFSDPVLWGPSATAIIAALLMAVFTLSASVPAPAVMNVGLAFEIVGSYGIAVAEFIDPTRLDTTGWMGLSWVALWTLFFAIVIPTRPHKAALVTLASVSSVPIVIGLMIVTRRATYPDPAVFFFFAVFPYLLVAIMAYVGARVVYGLGKAVTEARELGSYRLVERLGQGGMGEVWRARHRLLARSAAVKLIRPRASNDLARSEEAMRRFEREAQVTASLTSPHTVHLFDFGVSDDGGFYYVMELLDGLDLETLVRRHGPLPAERVIYLLRQVCHSLAEANSYGLVHRDIKPANIFVCRYGGEYDFVKVLDFGIVKRTREVMETGAADLTHADVLPGTPAYLAPEQALGDHPVDGRTDIYAAGCVAYFLLTGQTVFAGETAMAVVLQHLQSTPAPPSQASELLIPPALDALVLACLAKSPGDRPQSAKELSGRLGQIQDLHSWTEERAQDWWHAHEPARQETMS
jgi:serine/threonine-protein kinase